MSGESLRAIQEVIKANMNNGGCVIINRELRNLKNRKVKASSGFCIQLDRSKNKLRIFDSNNNLVTFEGGETVDLSKIPRTGEELMMFFMDFFAALSGKKIKMKGIFSNLIFRIE